MLHRFDHRAGHYALLLGLGAALFLTNLGGPTLWDLDEGRNATAALEMLESDNWIVPTFNGELRAHKPVLLYWLQAAAYSVFGVSEFAARLPSALAALVALLAVYELGRSLFGATVGLLGAVILGSAAMYGAAAHFANPDALLCATVLLTLWPCWLAYQRNETRWFLPAGVAAGLAVLAKGPSGLVLPYATVALFLVWSRRLGLLFSRGAVLGGVVCVFTALPWYVLVAVDTKGAFLREFLLTHHFDRAVTSMENHGGPPYYYLLVLLAGLAPWSFFLAPAFWYGGRAVIRREEEVAAYRFLGCWIAVYLLAFTLARTKLPNYILPIYPAVALLTARFLDRWRRGDVQTPAWLMPGCFVGFALIGVGTAAGLLLAGGTIPLARLSEKIIPELEVWAVVGIVPAMGAAVAWWLHRRQQRGRLVAALGLSAALYLLPLLAWGSVAINGHKPSQPLVAQAGALCREREILIATYSLEHLPSLNFYCQRTLRYLRDEAEAVEWLRYPCPVFLFIAEPLWRQLEAQAPPGCRVLARHRDLYRGGAAVVVSNR